MTLSWRDVQAAYSGGAGAWAAGPAGIYRAMAEPLVEHCPLPLADAAVLDFGAGTGATTAAIAAAGARLVATDLTPDMLRLARAERPPSAAADVRRLPFRSATFDAAMGAFVLSHVPEPVDALAEVARCVRRHGVVATVGFSSTWEHPVKAIVEQTVTGFGFVRPTWYDTFHREVEPLTSTPDRLSAAVGAAGLADVSVTTVTVDTGVSRPDELIAWRLGTPSLAPFVAGLDAQRRDELLAALRDTVGDAPEPLVPELLVMTARVR